MSFQVSRFTENGLNFVRLQDNATNTIITILPSHGALLHAFEVPVKDASFNIIDNYANKEELDKDLRISYKSSKLSPFVCRLRDGKYTIDGEPYEIGTKFHDGNAIHGLLWNKEFHITDLFADDNSAQAAMRYHYKKDDAGYPFDYVCEVRYTLLRNSILQVETTLLNLEDLEIPIADGWHPYFQLGGAIDNYELQFNSNTLVEFDERLLPTGNLVHDDSFAQPARIGNRQLDNCVIIVPEEGKPCVALFNPDNRLLLTIVTNERYSYLQLYTPRERTSIAIENLSSAPDCFNNGMGLVMLPPRSPRTFTVWYQAGVAEND